VVALRHGRNFVGVELNADYAKVAQDRIYDAAPMMNTVTVIGEDDE
jgi:DNA modification methylase